MAPHPALVAHALRPSPFEQPQRKAVLLLAADPAEDIHISDLLKLAGWAVFVDIEPLTYALDVVLVGTGQPAGDGGLQTDNALVVLR